MLSKKFSSILVICLSNNNYITSGNWANYLTQLLSYKKAKQKSKTQIKQQSKQNKQKQTQTKQKSTKTQKQAQNKKTNTKH